jgi:DNA-binding PadR family transcriptional regulator
LASHLRALENEGYIEAGKEIINRKPRTTYIPTKKGLRAFQQLRTGILKVMESDIER